VEGNGRSEVLDASPHVPHVLVVAGQNEDYSTNIASIYQNSRQKSDIMIKKQLLIERWPGWEDDVGGLQSDSPIFPLLALQQPRPIWRGPSMSG
jgi:hypothetical protein